MKNYRIAEKDMTLLQFGERRLPVLLEAMAAFLCDVDLDRVWEVTIDRDISDDETSYWSGRIYLGPVS